MLAAFVGTRNLANGGSLCTKVDIGAPGALPRNISDRLTFAGMPRSAPRRDIGPKSAPPPARPGRRRATAPKRSPPNPAAQKARRKFLRAFPGGFRDETYLDWERDYKWNAHLRSEEALSK